MFVVALFMNLGDLGSGKDFAPVFLNYWRNGTLVLEAVRSLLPAESFFFFFFPPSKCESTVKTRPSGLIYAVLLSVLILCTLSF